MNQSTLPKLILVLVFASLFQCGFDDSGQIGQETRTLELQNGLNLALTTFSYGLNGQHKNIILSEDSLYGIKIDSEIYPVFSGYAQVFILDTLPTAILYAETAPENLGVMDQFEGKLNFKKVGGSDLYWMSQSERPNLISLTE